MRLPWLLTVPILAACGDVEDDVLDGAPQVDAVTLDASADAALCLASPTGLAARWRGDQNTDDDSGLYAGLAAGGLGYGPGRHGSAFLLDGIDDAVVADRDDALWPSGSFSIEAWINVPAAVTRASWVVQKYECGGADACGPSTWSLFLDASGHVVFDLRVIAGGGLTATATLTTVTDGRWHHLVGVRDLEAAQLLLYVDGAVAATQPLPASFAGPLADDDGVPDPLTIGAGRSSGSDALGAHLAGAIDEVALFTTALDATQIAALYASEVGPCR